MAAQRRPAGPAPDVAELRDAALSHLARYATTEAALRRMLERRIDRWARRAVEAGDPDTVTAQTAASRGLVREVVARLAAAGAVNDAVYAGNRTHSLVRAGRSRRAVAAYLAAKGVEPEIARGALSAEANTELAAALVLARKRRIGPFRNDTLRDEATRRRELGVLARAGFPLEVAQCALNMDPCQAEAVINEFRR